MEATVWVTSEGYPIELTDVFVISYIYDSFLIEFVNWIVIWKFENNTFKSIPREPQVQGEYKSLSLKPQVQDRDT